MSDKLEIKPTGGPVRGEILPPGSKSITNRALVCAALTDGTSVLTGALDSEDTRVMVEGLKQLGIAVEVSDRGETLQVTGCAGKPPASQAEIFVGNSGTTIRFLTALVTLGEGKFRLDGIARMRERPIKDLADALNLLGAQVECEGANGCPPVSVQAVGLTGGTTKVNGSISSQFLSGLLMAAPCARSQVTLEVAGTLVSVPYVSMTLAVMKAFGITAKADADYSKIEIPAMGHYRSCDYVIEPDASAASYFWAAAAVTGGEVTVLGLNRESLQGDVKFVECLAQMGCEVNYSEDSITLVGKPMRGIDIDMNAISDTVQTLSVVALFAEGTTRIRNVGHIRHKETDRIAAVATELRKLGATVVEHPEGLDITPGTLRGAEIETYNDHRMAMSFAIVGLVQPGVQILNPSCTAKTYPQFFDDLERLARI
jgi:3-phosphoshikimate 1-carboxyvinyltransferase